MKKTHIFKTVLLMMTLCLLQATPAFSAESLTGSLDVFSGTQISGWVYEAAEEGTLPEIQIKITNSLTGELIKELETKPTYKRSDLPARINENTTPGFTVSVNMDNLPDGSYGATAYRNGLRFTDTIYYTKGNGAANADGHTLIPLGSFRLTAYCSCSICSKGWGRHTSSGALASANHTVAVDPRVIPIGSKLLINGTVYTAEDIGSAVKGSHIDIYHNSHTQARQFGSRTSEVFLLK